MAKVAPSTCGRGGRSSAAASAAQTRALTVKVFSRRMNGPPVPLDDFQFIVNENNVGDPQVGVPEDQVDESKIPSLKPPASHSPVIAAGDSANPTVYVPPRQLPCIREGAGTQNGRQLGYCRRRRCRSYR